ncbi:TonB-dependent receptor [Novosphingobium flavum]|uniref:TonB-dependent receptor n=1 Tax=Novosphingobium flavum TaxID=1778672 RepID=A0A7X1FQK0_9SPHN|nr:TonB-dependent receptor [Novosphingobium flavum]MBC2665140.1 TonB-dependent receptor [Novosphingobium flavum]
MVDTFLAAGRRARTTRAFVLPLSLAAALPCCAHAAEGDAAAEADAAGREIVVSGQGLAETAGTTAYSTTEIGREALTATASDRIEDALSSIAGFQQFRRSDSRSSNPSAQGATLRALGGNASSRTLVLLDGVPMADPFFGYIPYSALSPETLRAARVTRGGGSGPFGAGALSGTIALESAGPDQLGLASAGLFVNQRGETSASAALAPRLGSGFFVLSGRWDRGEGFWTTPASQRVAASVPARFASWSAGLRAAAPLSGSMEIQTRALVFRDNRTLRFAGADSASEGQDFSLRLVGRGRWQFDLLGSVQLRNFSSVTVSSSTFKPVLDQYKTPSSGLGGKLEVRPPLGAGLGLRLGADWRRADGAARENAINAAGAISARRQAGGVNSDAGLYADGDWTLGGLVLTGGLRADRTRVAGGYYEVRDGAGALTSRTAYADRSEWTATWRAGALVHAGAMIDLRAAAYTGLRQPTLNELYRPFSVFPVTTQANAALRNERLRGYEAGLDFTPAKDVRLSLTIFDNEIRDAIANVTIGTNLRQRQNVGMIQSRGVEVSAHAARGALRLDASLAWSDAELRNGAASPLTGMRPAQTPAFAASATVGLVPAEGWLLSATLHHVGRQFEDDLQTDVLPAATTLDAYARIPLAGRASLVLRAENLFDKAIITRNQGGSIDLGAPRTLWAGINWSL